MIKFVVFDFDGVFTDGKFYFCESKFTSKCYNAKDAYSLKLLNKKDIKCGIITNDKIVSIKYAKHIFNRLDKYSIGGDRPKLEILESWISEYNLNYHEIAYIGDDLLDIPVLRKVGFSSCPNNAIQKVKESCSYICAKDGGDGAVREFVEKILERNNNYAETSSNLDKLCFCVPARYESTRLTKKLLLKFGDFSCIQKTIQQISKSSYFNNNIYVFTDNNIIKDELLNFPCNVILTTGKYKNGTERISKNIENISTKYKYIINIQADEPFISPINIDYSIEQHLKNNENNVFYTTLHETRNSDVYLRSASSLKLTTTINNNVLYYSRNIIPWNKEGKVRDKYVYKTFTGIYVFDREKIKKYCTLNNTCLQLHEDCEQLKILENGYKIKSYPTREYNEISINTQQDYNYLLSKYYGITTKNNREILLDCTLRDGGYVNDWRFDDIFLDGYIRLMEMNEVDYVEIGFANVSQSYNKKPAGTYRSLNMAFINKFIDKKFKIAVMSDYKNINMELLEQGISVDLVRIAFHKGDLNDALITCKKIKDMGYKVSVNAMAITNYNNDDLVTLFKFVNNHNLDVVYIVDSYGSLNQANIEQYTKLFLDNLDSAIIGLHLHNNMNNALGNFECASKIITQKFFVDTTLFGMGRGAGNLQTELIILKRNPDIKYENLIQLLIFIQNKIKIYNSDDNVWGYELDYLVSGFLKIHPNYIVKMRELKLSMEKRLLLINKIVKEYDYKYFNSQIINELI